MFRSLLFTIFISLGLMTAVAFAFAEDGHSHSENVCSTKNPNICAHLGFLTAVNTSTEAQFYVHFFTPEQQEAQALKVDLWMNMDGHGHSSAPVEISPVGLNKYKVQKAWFVMTGSWLVRLTFTAGSETHQISIPVKVAD